VHCLRIRDPALHDIAAHASAAWPEEACGILIGTRPLDPEGEVIVERVRPTPNIAPPDDRRRRFEIDPREVIDTQRALRGTDTDIVGFFHSHPDSPARPSPTDLPFLRLWPRTVWLIVETREDGPPATPRAWWLEQRDHEPVEMPIDIG